MNNKFLVNLKQRNPLTGESLVTLDTPIRLEMLRPLGWHSYIRIQVAQMVLRVKQQEANGQSARDRLEGIREAFRQRHNAPKGWKP